ncbi:hypothetical protein AGABI2DRAFT_195459 [Agaricus bisporus var. bisporus H97]|uniref:hypothetical protein n=1 Tax=Agaricus bisporus var. bisporus (strain H97 / ATCC MYA-4626 / FGSC 10389) TaxID=936046 RepID=UPI00029F5C4B|nr:hypothetical protein AGABI2DRAFT_195459 [Agaricus bisporus var. bisporus H97]EKV43274.1 hypothetical protein AGABI2DRAFT_195459 [Agaricus bisporus var. bisporus H97]
MANKSIKPVLPKIQPDKEEDLDDLDDVLDEFSEGTSAPKAPPPSALPSSSKATSTPFGNRPRHNTRVDAPPVSTPGLGRRQHQQQPPPHLDSAVEIDETALSEDFARELAQEMENLLKGIDTVAGGPAARSSGGDGDGASEEELTKEERDKLQAAWTAALVEQLADSYDAPSGPESQSGKEGSGQDSTTPNNFQWQIKQAMEKLKESESNLKTSSNTPGVDPQSDVLQNLLKSLGDFDLEKNGENDESNGAEIAATLENVMGQLMAKDILYEPLKDLGDNFPGFLANPPKPLDPALRTRYENQYSYIKQIIAVFESPNFDESNMETTKKILGLMNDMQSQGSPPPEIMGPMPPLLEHGLSDDNCTIA